MDIVIDINKLKRAKINDAERDILKLAHAIYKKYDVLKEGRGPLWT